MIETRLLHYFLAVAREQNITRAAAQLHVTQPTLSKQLMDLERQLGKRLFLRGKRSITLTEEGRFLRARAQDILDIMDNTESAFRSRNDPVSGDVNIACGETAAMDMIAEVFGRLRGRCPDIRLHTHSGDADTVLGRIEKGLADMGLLISPVKSERYDYLRLPQKDRFGLLVRRDSKLAERSFIKLSELESIPLIMSAQTFSRRQDNELLKMDYSKLNIVATYNLIYNATFLVERGLGCALCLDDLVNTENRDLAFVPIKPEVTLDLFIVTKRFQSFSPAAKLFLEELKSAANG